MRFTHIADCHIGSYRDEKLKDLSTIGFCYAMDWSIEKDVDFILIAGDLFNTALPGIDNLKKVTQKLHELKQKGIPIYLIAGSHDFSPTGKTMLDVLEEAGLCINVMRGKVIDNELNLKFTTDKKTSAKLTGILGKRGMLDRSYYENLNRSSLENESGFKIFLFHTALEEFKPKDMADMEAAPLSLLPKNFDYYAGGHVHYRFDKHEPGYGLIVYPGPIFPNSFSELEKLHHGTFCYYEDGKMTRVNVPGKEVFSIKADASGKTPQQVVDEIEDQLFSSIGNEKTGGKLHDRIILIRVWGKLSRGKTTDINLSAIFERCIAAGAYFIMKNTYKLESEEFQQLTTSAEEQHLIEDSLLNEHAGQILVSSWTKELEVKNAKALMQVFSSEKKDGEKAYEFESRVISEADAVLEIDKKK